MTSVVHVKLPLREDVVTDGGDAGAILANAPRPDGRVLRGAQGGGMSELTSLTLKAALEGLRTGAFSSEEITRAHVEAVEAARALNAFVLETPDKAIAMARAADARIASGDAGPLEGAPIGVKDLFCTHGVRTTAGSLILENFGPHLRIHRLRPTCGATGR